MTHDFLVHGKTSAFARRYLAHWDILHRVRERVSLIGTKTGTHAHTRNTRTGARSHT